MSCVDHCTALWFESPKKIIPTLKSVDECDCFSAKSSVLTGVGATIVSIIVNASTEGGEEQL